MLVPLAHLLVPDLSRQQVAVATLARHIESVSTMLTGSTQVVLNREREVLNGVTESNGILLSELLQVLTSLS